MSKLIYVDRLKKDILALPNCYNGFSDTFDKACIIGVIDEQPTIEERKWIPVSERLPERCKYYIVTDFGSVEEAYYNSDGRWFSRHDDKLKDVTAWMPLPEPYEEKDNERA